ncbi:hypothetical protein [Spirosoma endbachense]|uniref:Lipoprotein n=1 Tax=Spirosoma endbachense TaxID=2666025 RepID=A0A6P1W1H2_9BACT|nr:hypothetical protein [Spirosoma endbachense]QHV98875.1 hypothetical protein GJR95_29415 [Spirosoma endbachense]
MRTNFIGFLLSMTLVYGCQMEPSVTPETTGPEPEPYRITRDSVKSGNYLGIAIDEEAATVYPKIQALQQTKGVTYLNVVNNVFSELTTLKERLPLYQYILLDQKPGTDSGVQITIEGQAVKGIYLNSGQQLTQWPEKQAANSSVRVGDPVSSLYEKLASIRSLKAYTNKFEYISLLTKNLSAAYDSGMNQSPQWYFGYSTGPDQMDQIQVHFQDGKVSKLYIDHYAKY